MTTLLHHPEWRERGNVHPTHLFLSLLHILLYTSLLFLGLWADGMITEDKINHMKCSFQIHIYISVFSVLLSVPAGSVWTGYGPPEPCTSSQSLYLLQLQSVLARSERCGTALCIMLKLSCEWRPSPDLQNKDELYMEITSHVQTASSITPVNF